jgi:hypothetical protein
VIRHLSFCVFKSAITVLHIPDICPSGFAAINTSLISFFKTSLSDSGLEAVIIGVKRSGGASCMNAAIHAR